MKNLKLLLLIFFGGTSMLSFSQDRTNREDVTFIKKSERITKAVGWDQEDGKWYDHSNLINSSGNTDTSKCDNFYWLQSAIFNYKAKQYHVFFYEHITGHYKYPAIEQDWYTFHEVVSVVMNDSSYKAFKLVIEKKQGVNINMPLSIQDNYTYGEYNEPELAKTLTTRMEKGSNIGTCFIVNSQTVKGENVVRFLLPGKCFDTFFDTMYFEIPAVDFKKLFID